MSRLLKCNQSKTIHCKIVYFGPAMVGKTTNLAYLHKHLLVQHRSNLTRMTTPSDCVLFFDSIPTGIFPVHGFGLHIHFYTVSGPFFYENTLKMVLRGASGIVFVADSQHERSDANQESVIRLHNYLKWNGIEKNDIPIILQCNKQDLPGAVEVEQLKRTLNWKKGTAIGAIAYKGHGVINTFETLVAELRETIFKLDIDRIPDYPKK
ncbi:MAG TPA: GTPase domain-containing protein [Acidobacteriota bacterium]|nr:GTPase domain-containing protein [Acidobacteriota bacterium]